MTVYYVDDGGSGADGLSWATAYTTLAALQTAIGAALSTDGNIVYIGADSVSAGDGVGATKTFTGPTAGVVRIISATVGTTTYAKSSSNQIIANGGDYKIEFVNCFALYGIQISSTGMIKLNAATSASGVNSSISTYECTLLPGGNRQIELTQSGTTPAISRHHKLTVYPDKDSGSNNRQFFDVYGGITIFTGLVLQDSASGRNGPIFSASYLGGRLFVSGSDLSTIASQSAILSESGALCESEFVHCKTLASPTWSTGTINVPASIKAINCASADAPEGLYQLNYWGSVVSSTSAYRDSGATIEGVSTSWKMVSASSAKPDRPLYTPWVYVPITSSGTKTFTVYVSQDGGAGDLTDAETWLEVEYMGSSGVGTTTQGSDQAALGDWTGTAQADDASSTWTGITETYAQTLVVASVSVGEEGLARARVALGKASTTLYVDPLVTVS